MRKIFNSSVGRGIPLPFNMFHILLYSMLNIICYKGNCVPSPSYPSVQALVAACLTCSNLDSESKTALKFLEKPCVWTLHSLALSPLPSPQFTKDIMRVYVPYVCVCLYVCVCIYMPVCACVCLHEHTHTHTQIHTYILAHTHKYPHTYTYLCW